jgi:hypothetical protein
MKSTFKPKKFVTNRHGKNIGVVLSIKDYKLLLSSVEELESIRAYEAAKASGDEAVPFQKTAQKSVRSRK